MISQTTVAELAVRANRAVDNALVNGPAIFIRPPTTEVGYVAAVVLGAIPEIATTWAPVLAAAGLRCTVAAVFCHQSPRVAFSDHNGGQSTRELADLLLVHDDLATATRRAALIQAKMTNAPAIDAAQLHLYSVWPSFVIRHQAFDQRTRDFAAAPAPPATDSGRYGLIDDSANVPIWYCVQPAQAMTGAGSPVLGTFLAEMLDVNTPHRGRSATRNGTDDWSFTIDELLRITANRKFRYALALGGRRARAGTVGPLYQFVDSDPVPGRNFLHDALLDDAPRIAVELDVMCLMGSDGFGGDGDGPPAPGDDGPEGPRGVSVVRIVTGPLGEADH